jgi:murein DD-endopeptidase MepM/ murein hydrolase activator NlpD
MVLPLLTGAVGTASKLIGGNKPSPKVTSSNLSPKLLAGSAEKKSTPTSIIKRPSYLPSIRPVQQEEETPRVTRTRGNRRDIKRTFLRILGTLKSLRKTQKESLAFEKKDTEETKSNFLKDRREKKEKKREGWLDSVGKVFRGIGGRITSSNVFEKIQNFFLQILIGSVLTWAVKNINGITSSMEKAKDKIKETFKTIDDYAIKPLWGMLKPIVGPIWNGIKKIIPPDFKVQTAEIIEKLNDIAKEIPILGDLSKQIQDALEPFRSRDGGVDGDGEGLATGAIELGGDASDQVRRIGVTESDYDIFRNTIAQIESGGKYDVQGGAGDKYAGRYQMGAAAREDAARYLGETYEGDSEAARKRFREDAEMQERYFAAYTRANHTTLMRNPIYAEMSPQERLRVLGYAHNQGASAASEWLNRGMTNSGEDANGTKGSRYYEEIKRNQRRPASTPGAVEGDPVVSSEYGKIRGGKRHGGVDIAAPTGTKLRAVSDGEIVDYGDLSQTGAKRGDPTGWGNFIVVKDSNGMYNLYGHLSNFIKRSGSVKKGEAIAEVGSTGYSEGPHLHWELGTSWSGGKIGGSVNPLSYYNYTEPFKVSELQVSKRKTTQTTTQAVSKQTPYEDGDGGAVVVPVTPPKTQVSPIFTGGQGTNPSQGTGVNSRISDLFLYKN